MPATCARPVLAPPSAARRIGGNPTGKAAPAAYQTPGWHLDLTLRGASGENSYKDAEPLIGELARSGRLPAKVVRGDIGTVNPARAVTAEETYVAAFFGRFLRGQASPPLDGPSPRYPEIQFVR